MFKLSSQTKPSLSPQYHFSLVPMEKEIAPARAPTSRLSWYFLNELGFVSVWGNIKFGTRRRRMKVKTILRIFPPIISLVSENQEPLLSCVNLLISLWFLNQIYPLIGFFCLHATNTICLGDSKEEFGLFGEKRTLDRKNWFNNVRKRSIRSSALYLLI